MSIFKFNITFPGQIDVTPRIGHLYTDATLATVSSAGFLNPFILTQGISILPTDVIIACCSDGIQWFKPVFTGSSIQLTVLP